MFIKMHNYLFLIIPIVYVFAKNQEEMYSFHALCFAIGGLVLTFILRQLFRFVFKDKTISDLFLSFGWIIFWTIHPFVKEVSILFKSLPVFILTYRWFLLLIGLIFCLAICLVLLGFLQKSEVEKFAIPHKQ